MKRIIMCALLTGLSVSAHASQLNGKYPVCTSKAGFERLQAAIKHNDEKGFAKVMKKDCFMPAPGSKIDKIVSSGWKNGIAQIKVYADGELYDLWTNTESLLD